MAEENLPEGEKRRFSAIIHDETLRLTRLLDDLLDLSVLENGEVALNWQDVSLTEVLDRAEAAALPAGSGERLAVERQPQRGTADPAYRYQAAWRRSSST